MARNFTITTPSETVRVGPDGRGEMVFTVTNVSGLPARGLGKIVPLGSTNAEWLSLSEVEREFPATGMHQFRVGSNIPPGTPAGRYTWRFDVVSAAKAGESIDLGPTVAFEVAPSEPPKKGIPWWVWLAIVIAAVVLAVVLFLAFRKKDPPPPPPPPPEVVKVTVPNVVGRHGISAAGTLERAGLDPDIDQKFVLNPGDMLDKVEDQDPDAGTEVEKGATVKIVVVQKRGIRPLPDRVKGQHFTPAVERALERARRRGGSGQ